MSLIEFTKNRWPWNYGLTDFLEREHFFNDDFFNLEKSSPAINIKEHEDNFEIELSSPGFDKKDFEISLKDHVLEISAEKEKEETGKDNGYACKEFNYRSFRRALQLPKTIDESKDIRASYKSGILRLNLQKKEDTDQKPKKMIEVV
ncbi:Hsp20/alpha crystallin family protein [Ulvibacterium marinum]|uniref:Hsp20/alpha crystallin family protein n=1 Tax=Ulvibacterium marinum TaxID=2419782 RepID=UPI0024942482|nr:Hsp20/alpha crystallin family protein [Ulvibacterium marinum]